MVIENKNPETSKRASLHALEWLNFFVADVQTGIGPFLAAYLAANGWKPERLGMLLTVGGLMPIALQIPAGGLVDGARNKRALLAAAVMLIAAAAMLLGWRATMPVVLTAQILLACAVVFVGPLLGALALGIVGPEGFDRQLGRNQSFGAAGNVVTALLLAAVSYWMGMRWIFIFTALLAVPTLACLNRVMARDIDPRMARGALTSVGREQESGILRVLLQDRVLVVFFLCAALFHLANAAMLPELGEMLARGHARAAGPLMSACVIVTQLVISLAAAGTGRLASRVGRRPLLLTGFAVLVVRGCLYTVVRGSEALIAVQVLDGIANVVFGVVSVLVIADRTRGTGRFNLAQGALACFVGIGASLSTAYGGFLIQHFSFNASFLGLAGVGLVAFCVLLLTFPETRAGQEPAAETAMAA